MNYLKLDLAVDDKFGEVVKELNEFTEKKLSINELHNKIFILNTMEKMERLTNLRIKINRRLVQTNDIRIVGQARDNVAQALSFLEALHVRKNIILGK